MCFRHKSLTAILTQSIDSNDKSKISRFTSIAAELRKGFVRTFLKTGASLSRYFGLRKITLSTLADGDFVLTAALQSRLEHQFQYTKIRSKEKN